MGDAGHLAGEDPLSQQELAGRLRIDRTTMVALVDGLEEKGWSAADRTRVRSKS